MEAWVETGVTRMITTTGVAISPPTDTIPLASLGRTRMMKMEKEGVPDTMHH